MADARQNAKNIFRMATTKREIILIGQLGKSLEVEEYVVPVGSWLSGLCEHFFLEAMFHEFCLSLLAHLYSYITCAVSAVEHSDWLKRE